MVQQTKTSQERRPVEWVSVPVIQEQRPVQPAHGVETPVIRLQGQQLRHATTWTTTVMVQQTKISIAKLNVQITMMKASVTMIRNAGGIKRKGVSMIQHALLPRKDLRVIPHARMALTMTAIV
jgi:hypothetical protein